MTKKTIIVFLITLLASCSPYGLTKIDLLLPGEVSLPSGIKKISLAMVHNEYTMPAGRFDSIDNLKLDPEFNYYKLAKDILFGMRDELETSPKFDTILISKQHNFDLISSGLDYNWTEITRICKKDSTDALILINHIYLIDTLKFIPSDEMCFVEYQLNNHLDYNIFYPKLLLVFGTFTSNHATGASEIGYDCNAALNQLPDGGDMLVQSCYENGQKAVRGLAPFWKDDINRIYYIKGNKFLKEGTFYAKRNMWHEAAEYWRNGMESSKKNITAKAAFNMALVCEIEDRMELANKWIQISDSLKSTNLSKQYRNILDKRMKQRRTLDQQMDIEK